MEGGVIELVGGTGSGSGNTFSSVSIVILIQTAGVGDRLALLGDYVHVLVEWAIAASQFLTSFSLRVVYLIDRASPTRVLALASERVHNLVGLALRAHTCFSICVIG